MVDATISLSELQVGQRAEISHLVGEQDHVHRLREMGIANGTVIEMFRSGNPCILKVQNSKFCLRADGALDVFVRPHSD